MSQPQIYGELVALNAPWVAYQENFLNVDVGEKEVGILNLRNGARRHCTIGGWTTVDYTDFSVTGIVVTPMGTAAWIGEQERLEERQRKVFACVGANPLLPEGARRRLLDEGDGIALHSLRLHGNTLSWTDAGARRSAQLK